MGLPIILAVPDGEARHILEADGAGLWVPPEDPEALALAMKTLCNDTAQYETFAAASLASAPHHSREKQAQDMIDVFKRARSGQNQSQKQDPS
jgi:colanic acid biosynthesis glycosyl transferase WcaI